MTGQGETSPVVEAVADLVIADETRQVETAIIIDNVIDNANARVDAAQEMATQIAEAALESERGRAVQEQGEKLWRLEEDVRGFRAEMEGLKTQLAEVMAGLSALTVLQIAAPTQTDLSSSIQPISEGTVQEAISEVTEILPANLENVAEENPVPVPPVPAKRRRWI